jgi:hypothetical protein
MTIDVILWVKQFLFFKLFCHPTNDLAILGMNKDRDLVSSGLERDIEDFIVVKLQVFERHEELQG